MSARGSILVVVVVALATFLAGARPAHAQCHCVSIAADVSAAGKLKAELGDNLYASGKFAEALAAYAEGWGVAKDAPFVYAQAMCQWQLGASAEAKALLEQYLKLGGKAELKYASMARAALADVTAGVSASVAAGVGGAARAGGDLVGGVAGGVGDVGGDVAGGVAGGVGAGADLAGDVTAKPKKIAGGAAMVLGVVAIGAIAAVGIQGIVAGVKDDIDFDYGFGIGMGVAGVSLGVTAIYLSGLTVATGATGMRCQRSGPAVAPMVFAHGGGLAAAFAF